MQSEQKVSRPAGRPTCTT